MGLAHSHFRDGHGTAYDIAGTGQASPGSMVAAITMAADQARWLSRNDTP